MPLYKYEARNNKGEIIKGQLEASDEQSVRFLLRERSFYPTNIKVSRESKNVESLFVKKVSIKDIAILCKQMSFMLTSGVSILRTIETVKEQTENSKLKEVLGKVHDDVQKGQTLSEGMGKHRVIPSMLVNMIEVGETSGTLDRIMERMAGYYDKEYRQAQKVKQALTYPAVISVFSFVVVILLVVKVLPTFVGMLSQFSTEELPLPTRIIMGISDFAQTKWWLLIIVFAAIILGFSSYANSKKGAYSLDRIKTKIPVFGNNYKKIIASRFARTFGTLVASGVPLMASINICSQIVGNKIYEEALKQIIKDIEKGASVGETIEDTKLFPPMLTQMIKVGEESGTLDMILEKTAEFYDAEVDTATAQMTSMLEPIIIVTLSVVVGFIIIAIIMPMFQMYNAMGT